MLEVLYKVKDITQGLVMKLSDLTHIEYDILLPWLVIWLIIIDFMVIILIGYRFKKKLNEET